MRRLFTYTAILLLPGVTSCRQESLLTKDRLPNIAFSVNAEEYGQTKGSINSNGTVVRIYDYLTGFTGSIDSTDYNSGNLMYINGEDLVYDSSDAQWVFDSGELWQWTRTGTHHFFGFLTEDHSVNPTLTSADLWDDGSTDVTFNSLRSFSIPQLTLTRETKQFDLCYSSWVSVASESRTSDYVLLPMKHAFMAFSVTISNTSDGGIKIGRAHV